MKREKLSLLVLAVEIAAITLLHSVRSNHEQSAHNDKKSAAYSLNSAITVVPFK